MSPETDELADALEAMVGEGYGQFAPRIRSYLAERDVHVRKDWERIWKREREADNARRKAEGHSRFEAAPLYKGTNVKHGCQATVMPARGAPTRCHNKHGLRVFRERSVQHLLGRLFVVCGAHARSPNYPSIYSGWAGDPNPKLGSVEPEYEEMVPR